MADPPRAITDPPSTMADPPSDPVKHKFTGKIKKSGITYHRKKCQTSSAEEAVAVHAVPDANHEVASAVLSMIILQRNWVVVARK